MYVLRARLQRVALEAKRDVRRRGRAPFDAEAAVEKALGSSPERIVGARGAEDDAKRLRGIPVVGGTLGGAIPGSRPDRDSRLDRWSGRG